MHEVLVNRFGDLGLPRKSVVRLTDRPDMTLHVYHGHKTTTTQQIVRIFMVPKVFEPLKFYFVTLRHIRKAKTQLPVYSDSFLFAKRSLQCDVMSLISICSCGGRI